jgi:hypothetical protein
VISAFGVPGYKKEEEVEVGVDDGGSSGSFGAGTFAPGKPFDRLVDLFASE